MKLEHKKYYIPIYCIRHWPSAEDIYDYIIAELTDTYLKPKSRKIVIYTSEKKAREIADSYLCDDDCSTTATLDFTNGYCSNAYITAMPEHKISLPLYCNQDIYNVDEQEKIEWSKK